jgi:hypothetical protein
MVEPHLIPSCINLAERFGDRYRITFDAPREERRQAKHDPWLHQIPCKFGTIYPFGGNRLAVDCDYCPRVCKQLVALPGLTLHQHGDHEQTFTFDVADFDAVAAIVRPRRRRQLSPEHNAKLQQAGQRYRFSNGTQSEISERQATISHEDGLNPT